MVIWWLFDACGVVVLWLCGGFLWLLDGSFVVFWRLFDCSFAFVWWSFWLLFDGCLVVVLWLFGSCLMVV